MSLMPNTKSAIKRVKVAERNRLQNKSYTSAVKTLTKNFHAALEKYQANPDCASEELVQQTMSAAYSKIDKAVKVKALHRNTAARKKSKLAKTLKKINQELSATEENKEEQIVIKGKAKDKTQKEIVIEREEIDAEHETYAIAYIKDHESEQTFQTYQTYHLQAGIRSKIPEGAIGEPLELPSQEESIQFEIIVWAEDMEIKPDWIQNYIFIQNKENPFVEFQLKPKRPGYKLIRIEFLYKLHWLAKIELKVEVVELQELVQVS